MRAHGRTDANHKDFIAGMRNAGWKMADTSALGGGFPDCIGCAPDGTVWLYEVKNPDQPPSKLKLKPLQEQFHRFWSRCPTLMVVMSVEQALEEYAEPTRKR